MKARPRRSWSRSASYLEQLEAFRKALGRIEALDRKGRDSDVAADMGYIARTALSNPARRPK